MFIAVLIQSKVKLAFSTAIMKVFLITLPKVIFQKPFYAPKGKLTIAFKFLEMQVLFKPEPLIY